MYPPTLTKCSFLPTKGSGEPPGRGGQDEAGPMWPTTKEPHLDPPSRAGWSPGTQRGEAEWFWAPRQEGEFGRRSIRTEPPPCPGTLSSPSALPFLR